MKEKELFQKAVGKHIRDLRKARSITQVELAVYCGMEKSNISRIELGGVNPTIYTLKKISEKLEVTLPELLDFEFKK